MHDWCAKDGNNKVFPFLFAFMPSKAQWAYTFACRDAGALKLGTSLSRTVKINSDADKQETRAICNAIGKKKNKRYVVLRGKTDSNDPKLPVYKKQIRPPPYNPFFPLSLHRPQRKSSPMLSRVGVDFTK